jgi:prepilin-type N-terminal cleavage/methylation domain-containing protein
MLFDARPVPGLAVRRFELQSEGGMTLIELLVVLAILVVVIAGLTQLFISSIRSETDQTNRVGAQQDARLSLDQLRRELHCGSGLTLNSSSSVTVTLPSFCTTAPVTTLTGAGVTLPFATINVGSTARFNTGANKISISTSGTVSCTGTTATSFTGCSLGTGFYSAGTSVVSQVTWCASGGSAPYSLRRFVGDSALTSGCAGAAGITPRTFASSLTSNALFSYNRSSLVSVCPSSPCPTVAAPGGTLTTGTYAYDVTALLSTGAQVSGAIVYATVSTGSTSRVTVSWSPYTPPVGVSVSAYYVYGRDDGSNTSAGLRLLKIVTCPCGASPSYADNGPTTLTSNPYLTVPASGTYSVPVADTSSFNTGGANTITFGSVGSVNCTNTTSTSFTGCTGGVAGNYNLATTVDNASTIGPPLATLSVALTTDKSPGDSTQRFSFSDDIALRNSGRF